jgi:predicted hotdog family 3-hydroxylacyl-ACP dehydratase
MLKPGIRYSVDELVPHRGPMSLLDRIDDYGEDWLKASVEIRPGGLFATADGVPAWVGIEYMAQAASAFGGIEQVQRGESPSIGLLIGARYYRSMVQVFPFGSRLDVLAKIAMRDSEDFAAYDCSLSAAGTRLAECVLKAYRPRDLAPLLSGSSARG